MELIKEIETSRNSSVLLKAIFEGDDAPTLLVKKQSQITEYLKENVAYVYLGKKSEFGYKDAYEFARDLAENCARSYQLDLTTFVTEKLCIKGVVDAFTKGINFSAFQYYNLKTFTKRVNENSLSFYLENISQDVLNVFKKALILVDAQNFARNLGVTPPNELNSEQLAEIIRKDFKKYHNLKVKVLERKQIELLGMDLLLSVNKGSVYEPRVVIIEYKGNPSSQEKTVLVGKGITFDSGGYSLKPPKFMLGMKYDMSGSAIVAAVMKAIAQLKPNKNVSAIMCITDGLYYGATKLHATRLIDIATLTGAILRTLGDTYTGIWATSEKAWEDIKKAADIQEELIWRMPFDKEYEAFMKGSVVADLKNTDYTGNAGSCSAAMFLREFTNNVEYIHCDIAGTNDIDEKPMFAMVKTLIEMSL